MKILFNCTVNVVGGAVQNSANFIKNAKASNKHLFLFLVSREVKETVEKLGCSSESIVVCDSPARSKKARESILEVEREFNPDIVYTMAGPTYVNFNAYHVMGVSDPYITHASLTNFSFNRSTFSALSMFLKIAYKAFYARFFANEFVFQTQTSRSGFCKRYFFDKQKTHILPNAIGEQFLIHDLVNNGGNSRPRTKIFVPSAYYPHKNIEITLEIANLLQAKNNNEQFCFVLTIPKESEFVKKIEGSPVRNMFEVIGPYSYADAKDLYANAEIIFIPSLLETFSTSYLEAIACAKPLIVADRPFAKEICNEYAYYFDGIDSRMVAGIIEKLKDNEFLVDQKALEERQHILDVYGTQQQRFKNIIRILENIYEKVYKCKN